LRVIEKAGVKVDCMCREGICGSCETAIVEGVADHRDSYLSDDEKAAQKTMMLCVSRCKGARLVLDL
jgi:ferredoxin